MSKPLKIANLIGKQITSITRYDNDVVQCEFVDGVGTTPKGEEFRVSHDIFWIRTNEGSGPYLILAPKSLTIAPFLRHLWIKSPSVDSFALAIDGLGAIKIAKFYKETDNVCEARLDALLGCYALKVPNAYMNRLSALTLWDLRIDSDIIHNYATREYGKKDLSRFVLDLYFGDTTLEITFEPSDDHVSVRESKPIDITEGQ